MEALKLPKVTIKNDGAVTNIFVDGKEIPGVRSIEFSHNREKDLLPVLRINLLAEQVTIDAPCIFELPEVYQACYLSAEKLIDAGVLTLDRLNELREKGLL